jgi:hypothetical protein
LKEISKSYLYIISYIAISDKDLYIIMMATAKMLICNDHLNEKEKKLVKKRCKEYQNFDDQQIEALVNNINEYYLSQLIKDDDFYKATSFLFFVFL